MDSFLDLGVDPALVEALASEGIERPNALQRDAIPLLVRGSTVVLRASPGSGLVVAYTVPLLARLPVGAGGPSAIVVTGTRDRARALALSMARLAAGTGHRVGALGVAWARPERSDLLVSTAGDVATALSSAGLKLDALETLILEEAASLLDGPDADLIASLLSGHAGDPLQVVVAGDPVTPSVRGWVDTHLRRAVFLPPESARGHSEEAPTIRGTLRVIVSEQGESPRCPELIAQFLEEGREHVLVFAPSTDDLADLGDLLGLHGYSVGGPAETAAVWLCEDPLEAREAVAEAGPSSQSLAVLSAGVPADVDELDRRHGLAAAGAIILPSREIPHLRRLSVAAGYRLEFAEQLDSWEGEAADFMARLQSALAEEDLLPNLMLLEPLLRRHGSAEIAAALAALLRKARVSGAETDTQNTAVPGPVTESERSRRPPAWAKLFLSVGRRDGVGVKDLLGAIVGECGVEANQVGRIDLRESVALLEVHDSVADRVIRGLNGTTIRGRSVRVDFDRGEARSPGGPRRAANDQRSASTGSTGPRNRG